MDDRKQRVRAEYDELSAGYEERWSSYVARSVDETRQRAHVREGERVLDVGCGTGRLLGSLRPAPAVGVDLSIGMLAVAPPFVSYACADAEALPFVSESFDVVVSSSSLHFWPHPDRALLEMHRVLVHGGRVVITDWCDDFLACQIVDAVLRWRDPASQRTIGRERCAQLLETAGFTNVAVERYRISWLWGLMTATGSKRR